jgi:hypothetical protein
MTDDELWNNGMEREREMLEDFAAGELGVDDVRDMAAAGDETAAAVLDSVEWMADPHNVAAVIAMLARAFPGKTFLVNGLLVHRVLVQQRGVNVHELCLLPEPEQLPLP